MHVNLKDGYVVMDKFKMIQKYWRHIFFAVFIVWMGYLFFLKGRLNFKEEVLLSNGEVIIVKRNIVTSSFGEIGGPGGWESKFNSLEIVQPERDDNPTRWETSKDMLPVLLDRDPQTKEWFLLAVLESCVDWNAYGRPETSYIEFRYHNSKWQNVPFSPYHLGRSYNILGNIRADDQTDMHTLATKDARMNRPGVDQRYVKIIQQLPNC